MCKLLAFYDLRRVHHQKTRFWRYLLRTDVAHQLVLLRLPAKRCGLRFRRLLFPAAKKRLYVAQSDFLLVVTYRFVQIDLQPLKDDPQRRYPELRQG